MSKEILMEALTAIDSRLGNEICLGWVPADTNIFCEEM